MKKIFLGCVISMIAFAANAENLPPLQGSFRYEANWSGMKAAELNATVNESATSYNYDVQIKTMNILKYITNYLGSNTATGKISGNNLIPESFSTKWRRKKGDYQTIDVTFKNKGAIITEIANPPESRGKRPELKIEVKEHSFDPLSLAMVTRRKIADVISSNQTLPKSFNVKGFDGRRVFDMKIEVVGYSEETFKKNSGKFLHVTASRTPIAGFTVKELEKFKQEDPVFDLYYDSDYIPVYAFGKASLGSASIELTKSCKGNNCNL